MTTLPDRIRRHIASATPAEAARLTEIADELDLATDLLVPDDLIAGLRRINAAVARAQRVYTEVTGSTLVKVA